MKKNEKRETIFRKDREERVTNIKCKITESERKKQKQEKTKPKNIIG